MIPQRHKLDWNSNRIPNLIDNAISSSCGNLIGIARTAATIVTTKVGTFASTWKGSGTLYFDPGDGGPIEPLVLTTGGVAWNHDYPSAGNKTIKITGDLEGVTSITATAQNIVNSLRDIIFGLTNLVTLDLHNNSLTGNISAVSGLTNLVTLYLHNNSLTGDISAVSGLTNLVTLDLHNNSLTGNISAVSGLTNLVTLSLHINSLTFVYTQFPPWDGNTYDLNSCVSTSQEVGDLILAAANGGMNNCIYKLDGTNPAPPATQEVTDAIVVLAGNGVTLYVNT
jgi:Leucine-rich repeat (LRR) protein